MCWFAALGTAMGASAATATMVGLSTTASIGGTLFSAYSAMQQSSASNSAANYNAAIQRNNAIAANYQANDAIDRGNKAVDEHMRKVAALKGSQTASMAARGLDISEGSPLNILTDTDVLGATDASTIKTNAAREAWGYKNQAANSTAQGNLYSMQASNQNPLMAGAGTLLSGAGSVADRWYSLNKGS
jgi:hypothetical protein